MDKLTLNNQVTIPLTGLGVYQINNLDECEHTVLNALKIGYRLIDTAACYGNEKAVGNAIKKSQIPREDIFISSKVWIDHNKVIDYIEYKNFLMKNVLISD